jgi:hypothetical protein
MLLAGNVSCVDGWDGVAKDSPAHSNRSSLPRVAIIMSGAMKRAALNTSTQQISSAGGCSSAGASEWRHWPLIAQNVNHVLARSAEVHTFVCISPSDPLPPEEMVRVLRIVQVVRNQSGTAADTWRAGVPLSNAASTDAQRYRWGHCFQLARRYEADTGATYEWFLRMRPDLLWFGEIAPLDSYSRWAVSSRARSLHGGYVPHNHYPLNSTIEHLSKLGQGCERNKDCTRSTARSPCMVPDDTFAIVPAHLAASYFLLESVAPALRHPPPDSAPRPFHSRWGNISECHPCLKCQRVFCQEFILGQQWLATGLIFELRGFRARLHPGHQRLEQGICSDYNELCSNLRNSRFWTSYKKDRNGQKAGFPQHYFDMPLGC